MDRSFTDFADHDSAAGLESDESDGQPRPCPLRLQSTGLGRQTRKPAELNLFRFDLKEYEKKVLLDEPERASQISYHEYAVFDGGRDEQMDESRSYQAAWHGEEGLRKLRDALRHGFGLNDEGSFSEKHCTDHSLQGRMRHVIVDRTQISPTSVVVLSFSANPMPPYDFLSMAYKLRERTATALIRRSFNSRWHSETDLETYGRRWDSCRDRWSHPLVLPVVMLQVQLLSTEVEVSSNNEDVQNLEKHVNALTGHFSRARRTNSTNSFRPIRKLSDLVRNRRGRSASSEPDVTNQDEFYTPPQTILLMKEAHDVLRGAIKLLDTLRWMERAIKLLIKAGNELDIRLKDISREGTQKQNKRQDSGEELDELSVHWHEVKQYLIYLEGLCQSLETDRRMSELRCRAQIDIIYSKMAQEDNNLNARMAVAATRDSSALKALAVITALFLPGEFISSLFGVSMFNWQSGKTDDSEVIMPLFWVYWAVSVPLTLFTVALWRGWWVNQDRHFRRHLSLELSNERYWTTDGKPRELETTFLQDFLAVFRPNASSARSTITGTTMSEKGSMSMDTGIRSPGLIRRGLTLSDTLSMAKEDMGTGDGRRVRSRQLTFSDERAFQAV